MIPHISSRTRRTLVLAATLGTVLALGAPGALAGTLPVVPSTAPAPKAALWEADLAAGAGALGA
ncbi:hypothetical protein, partial [Streptomyces scabiei]|uniref:hypothetical protein n=1 Tax=Streptomyces scabiei TaxID=1930 RepID=UPI0029A5F691